MNFLCNFRENCHRCENSNGCAAVGPIENQSLSISSGECSTDTEDIEKIHSLMKVKNKKPDHQEKLARNKSNLELEKYYEGEQHQSGRHVVVIVSQVLLMIVVSASVKNVVMVNISLCLILVITL